MNGRIDNENSMLEDLVSFYGFDFTKERLMENITKAERVKINAVYFLWLNKEIVYVGCTTTHPMERMKAHKCDAEFDEISWIEVPKPLMKAIEWFYIEKLNPPKNRNKYKPWLGFEVQDYTGIPVRKLNDKDAE